MEGHAQGEGELVAELNDLLQLDNDAVQAYTLAINALPRDAFSETLSRFRDEHERHVAELSELIRRRGGTPLRLPHLPTGVFKAAVQALGDLGDHRAVLLAFKSNESQVRGKYRRHADRPHPPEVADVLRRAADDEERHYAWAVEMLERLGAGRGTLAGMATEAFARVHRGVADAVETVERRVMETVEEARRGE